MSSLLPYIIDVSIHTLIGLVITLPLWIKPFLPKALFAVFIVTSLLDIDHFVTAKSIRIKDAVTLKHRPNTHSAAFAIAVGGITFGLTRNPKAGIAAGVGVLSHIFRDASSRSAPTPILWPLKVGRIPYWLYIAGEFMLFIGCWLIKKWV